jgi:hypothetical protein
VVCGLIAWELIRIARRFGQPLVHLQSQFGLAIPAFLLCAAIGVTVAVASAVTMLG